MRNFKKGIKGAVFAFQTDQYEDLRTNPEQKSETIHSITIEGLTPDTTYHYQILASDPRGRGQPKPSEDLQFRTSKEDVVGGPDKGGDWLQLSVTGSNVSAEESAASSGH